MTKAVNDLDRLRIRLATCRIDSEQQKKEKNGNRNRKLVDFILISGRKGTIRLNTITPTFAQI